jgi:propionate CoA-transferase
MSKVCTVAEAVRCIRDGDVVASTGVIGWLTPDALLREIAHAFTGGAGASDLTFYFPVGTGYALAIPGMDHVAIPGLMKRIVCGNYINPVNPVTGQRPALMRLIQSNEVEAYAWPIGASMHWLREVARRSPGYLTKVGLGTYIDPRQEGGRLNAATREQLVQVREFDGQEYLFYPTWDINVALIRASAADEYGNLSFDDEPLQSSAIALALATKACGGTVIAQVRKIVPRGELSAHQMRIPGALVDRVVIDAEAMMTTDVRFDERYLGGKFAADALPPSPGGADRIIARRAAREVREGEVTIFGFGASSDIPLVMAEAGLFDDDGIWRYPHITEHGVFGGVVMSGWQFSANLFPQALLDGAYQFDFIDGGNCGFAALAFAQFDEAGHVNVSKFASFNPGAGGFIDIATNTRRLVFTGTFTTGGLKVATEGGRLTIEREGKSRKFVRRVEQITYPLIQGVRDRGQSALLITERAVFGVERDGLVLKEIAPGVDVQRDVLGQMEFAPKAIASDLKTMDDGLFRD